MIGKELEFFELIEHLKDIERYSKDYKDKIGEYFDIELLERMLKGSENLSILLKNRIDKLENYTENKRTFADVNLIKQGRKKFVNFSVSNLLVGRDKEGKMKISPTGKVHDELFHKTLEYKKSDKNLVKEIKKCFYTILNNYTIYNYDEFTNEYNNAMSLKY